MIFPSLCILQICKVLLLSNCQSVSNRLNARQSKLFTECPQKVQSKRIGSIQYLVGNAKRLFKLFWICSRGILRNAPSFLTVGILSTWDRDRQSDHAIIENVAISVLTSSENLSTTNLFPNKHQILSVCLDSKFCGNSVNNYFGLVDIWTETLTGSRITLQIHGKCKLGEFVHNKSTTGFRIAWLLQRKFNIASFHYVWKKLFVIR